MLRRLYSYVAEAIPSCCGGYMVGTVIIELTQLDFN